MLHRNLAFWAFACAPIFGFPTLSVKRQEETFEVDPNGNARITVSKKITDIGQVSVDEILGKLDTACAASGQCDTSEIQISGSSSTFSGLLVKIEPSGAYPIDKRDDLLEALGAAIKALVKCQEISHKEDCSISNTAMAYCPNLREEKKGTACTVPQFWGISLQPPTLGDAAPAHIGLSLSVDDDDSNDGLCEDIFGLAGAIAGAVHGVAGGAVGVLQLVCKA